MVSLILFVYNTVRIENSIYILVQFVHGGEKNGFYSKLAEGN